MCCASKIAPPDKQTKQFPCSDCDHFLLSVLNENLLGGRFGEFSTLDNFNKASFILGFENWNRDDFKALLKLVKSFVLLIWETRKKELYGDRDCVVSGCFCSCPLTGGLTSSACVCGCVVNGVSATAAT